MLFMLSFIYNTLSFPVSLYHSITKSFSINNVLHLNPFPIPISPYSENGIINHLLFLCKLVNASKKYDNNLNLFNFLKLVVSDKGKNQTIRITNIIYFNEF